MSLTDTHCHIHSSDYPLDPEAVIKNAQKAGVTRLLCVGTTAEDSELAVHFAANHDNCWSSIGLHPHDAKLGEEAFATLRRLAQGAATNKIVAVGECGLDYFYHHSGPKDQEKALRFQIELALAHNLPLIFHVREAFDDFWPIFDSYKGVRGVLHSFTDTMANLEKALERGLYIGVNGIMTFTKNDWQLEVARAIPANRLLLETDAPFLTPTPLRGTMNEPANVRYVCTFVSELRRETFDSLARNSSTNATNLFTL